MDKHLHPYLIHQMYLARKCYIYGWFTFDQFIIESWYLRLEAGNKAYYNAVDAQGYI